MRIGIVVCALLGFVVTTEANFIGCRLPIRNKKTNILIFYGKTGKPVPSHIPVIPAPRDNSGIPITFKCKPGYLLKAWTPNYLCYNYGWYPFVPPKCVKRDYCERREAPAYGYVTPYPNYPGKPYYKIGSNIKFICQDGYRLEGKETDHCQKNGEWEHGKDPKCVLIKCPYRAPPTNGFVSPKKKVYFLGDIITFSCKKPKYVLVGKPKDKCGYDDEWVINQTPRCEITCKGRDAPKNGAVSPKRDYFFAGKFVYFKCNDGYRLEGSDKDQCKSDGNWRIDRTPKCVLITCPQRTAPENGLIRGVVDPYLPNNKIKFECEEGYRLDGEEYDTCTKDGSWDVNKTPTCKIIPCRQRKAPRNGKILGQKNPYVPEDTIKFECDEGYRLEGEDEDTCLLGGSWDIDMTPKCELITCRDRKAPVNGRIEEPKDQYLPEDTIKFVCKKYYKLEGEEMDTCQGDGSWEIDETPKCVQITCSQRDAPENGEILDEKDPYVPLNVITFRCLKGYRLVGEDKDRCEENGQWRINRTPKCVLITCPKREAPENGELLGEKDPYVPTNMITFRCNKGYRLVGEEKDRCEGNGKWKINRTPKCVLIICPQRDAPENGEILGEKNPYLPTNMIKFKCDKGYKIEDGGIETDTCQEDGTWEINVTPKCVMILCVKYKGPENGGYTLEKKDGYLVLQPGTKMFFFCNKYYRLVGYPFDHCQDDGTWRRMKAPLCVPDVYCYSRNPPLYGYLHGKQQRYSMGAKITFTCKTGYETKITYDECTADGTWKYAGKGKYPVCERVPGY